MQGATVCRNGFDADTSLPKNLSPTNWAERARPPVHTRMSVAGTRKRNRNKNKRNKMKGGNMN